MARITINGISLDPAVQTHSVASIVAESATLHSNYILLQTTGPLNKEQKAQLGNLGIVILEYVPEDTYLCNGSTDTLTQARALPFISWAGPYMKGFKIAPSLIAGKTDQPAHSFMEIAAKPKKSFSRKPRTVDIVFHKNIDPVKLKKKIAAAAHIDASKLKLGENKARIILQSKYLDTLASLDEVRHIEEVFPRKLMNDIARQILQAGTPGAGATLEGEGQVVVVADTGLDKGSATDVHPAFAGRVLKIYALGRPRKGNDPDGHGTHVAGSVLGNYSSTVLNKQVSGTAPKAKLIFQSVLDENGGLGGLGDDLHPLFQAPYDDGARIHTNSWGSTKGDGRYDSESFDVDDFIWKHRDFIVCFAAGNEGVDSQKIGLVSPGSLTPPGTAKNCITVGACESNRPEFDLTYGVGWPDNFPVAPIAGDKVADHPEGMVAFSSRGPTQDHRIKPDVVAPGTFILSALSRLVAKDPAPGWGLSDDPLLFFDGGTSMATPLVAGCVAVVREFLIKISRIPNPSAALVKALLINGASPIPGQYAPSEAGLAPGSSQGFGRVNLAATVGPYKQGETVTVTDEKTMLDTGEQEQVQIVIPSGGASLLKVTMAWTDPPGEKLQNDLDLIITHSSAGERHGNVAADSADFDRDNNVEQVSWQDIPAGNLTITVKAFRVPSEPQSYALVIRILK